MLLSLAICNVVEVKFIAITAAILGKRAALEIREGVQKI